MDFYRRHLCRRPEWPDRLMRTARAVAGNQVYATTNGPNDFTVIVTPACAETMRQGMAGAERTAAVR